nr:cuticle collagen 1-like [Columba livia]
MSGRPSVSSGQEPGTPRKAFPSTFSSGDQVQMKDILCQLEHVYNVYSVLKDRVDQLTENKVDRAEFEELQDLLTERGQQSMAHILADIQSQVSSLQALEWELQHMKQKVRQLEEAFGKLGLAGADGKAGSSHQIPLQLGHHRLAGAQDEVVPQPPLLGTGALPTTLAPEGWIGTPRAGQDWGVQPNLKGPGTEPVPRTSEGTPGTQPPAPGGASSVPCPAATVSGGAEHSPRATPCPGLRHLCCRAPPGPPGLPSAV